MKKRLIFFLCILLPIIMALVCMKIEIDNNVQSMMAVPLPLEFIGEYSYDGESWYTYDEDCEMSALDGNLIVRGHFDSELFEGAVLNFYCNHIGVAVYINGEMQYIDVQSEIQNYDVDLMPSMCGKRWEQMMCPMLTTEDEIEFHFNNNHNHGNDNAYKEFLSSLLITPQDISILEVYLESYIEPFEMVGYALIIVAAMLLGASLAAIVFKSGIISNLLIMGLATLFAGGYIVFDVMMVYFMDELLVVKTYGGQLCLMLTTYFVGMMICEALKDNYKKVAEVVMVASAIVNLLIIVVAISGKVLLYDTLFYWEIVQSIISVVLIVLCILQLTRKNKFTIELLLYVCVNIAILIDILDIYYGIYYYGICYKTMFVIMLIVFLLYGAKQVIQDYQASIKNKKLKVELEQSRIAVMLSQIQPHFLYNSLTSVMDLCDTNPKKAKTAIADFADYLRGNLNSLKAEKPISFRTELEHIEKYLRLEKLRFQDELEVVYDIQVQDFMIPALSVQPLIENAVKHGVSRKIGGGTVTIHTYETEQDYVICIIDDGVGFAMGEYADDGGTHIGIKNTRKRLELVNAKLEIESKKEEGTTACILIPKRRN